MNCPLDIFPIGQTSGSLAETFSLVSCPQENIVIETIKKAEADEAVIVRLYDAYNQKALAQLTTGFDFREVYLCDMLEQELEKLDCQANTVTVPVKNFEIVTLKFV